MPDEAIQRYALAAEGGIRPIVPYDAGDWVKFAAHEAEVAAAFSQGRKQGARDIEEQSEMLWSEINTLRARRDQLERLHANAGKLWSGCAADVIKQTNRAEAAEAEVARLRTHIQWCADRFRERNGDAFAAAETLAALGVQP
jgi:hypothetical protein